MCDLPRMLGDCLSLARAALSRILDIHVFLVSETCAFNFECLCENEDLSRTRKFVSGSHDNKLFGSFDVGDTACLNNHSKNVHQLEKAADGQDHSHVSCNVVF